MIQLSSSKCLDQLREENFLRQLVQLLHEHTFEPAYKPEENTNIESLRLNFNRKSEQRRKLSREIRTIIEKTEDNEDKLAILDLLEPLRDYTESLYSFIYDERYQATYVTESKPKVIQPIEAINELVTLVDDDYNGTVVAAKNRSIIELLGGIYVILELILAQNRFFAKFQDQVIYGVSSDFYNRSTESTFMWSMRLISNRIQRWFEILRPVQNEPSESVIWFTKREDIHEKHNFLLLYLFEILSGIFYVKTNKETSGSSRLFNQLMISIFEEANKDDLMYVNLVLHCSNLISTLNLYDPESNEPEVVLDHPYNPGSKLVECLTKLAIDIEEPKTKSSLLLALTISLNSENKKQKVVDFCSINGSIEMLIDSLEPCEDMDVKYAENYRKLRSNSLMMLWIIHDHYFLDDDPILEATTQLLPLYESRDIVVMLVHHIKLITSDDCTGDNFQMILVLRDILKNSMDQQRKFLKTDGALDSIKRFERFNDPWIVKFVKEILELYQ